MFSDDVYKLKMNLYWAITKEINEFIAAHGISPSAVKVNVADVTEQGWKVRKFAVASVELEFEV